ncbi:MAG: hypothetical protein ABSE46_01130 [Terracidiphilus sp.]
MSVESSRDEPVTLSESEKKAIRGQLERLLADPHFSHSKRFPTFLRFVTERTLAGEEDNINERWLGIEIFGRDPEYDTAADPIVRVTAAEIRKRVALYYQDSAHLGELRIALPSGSYIPRFHWPKGDGDPTLEELDRAAGKVIEIPVAHTVPPSGFRGRRSALLLAIAFVITALLSTGSLLEWQRMHRPPPDSFWQPVLTTKDPVLLCLADQLQYSAISLRDAAEPSRQIVMKDNLTAVVMDDVYATVKVAGILQSSGKKYTVRGEGATSLQDLRNGPTVFIGAFDNAWTLRLTNPLRFHFANNADMSQHAIVDSMTPAQAHWVVDRSVQLATNNYRDYGIVARFTDSNTGNLSVIVAGIGRGGTIAAGEFLTDPDDLAQIEREAKGAGDKKNMEIVLSTQIIDGQPGSPKIEAAYFW